MAVFSLDGYRPNTTGVEKKITAQRLRGTIFSSPAVQNIATTDFFSTSAPILSVTMSVVEGRDRLQAATSSTVPLVLSVSVGIVEGRDSIGLLPVAVTQLNVVASINEGRSFIGPAVTPTITGLIGADWDAGTSTGSQLSEVTVLGTDLDLVSAFYANGILLVATGIGTANPVIYLPASPGPYTLTGEFAGSRGVPVNLSKPVSAGVAEGRDVITATVGVTSTRNITAGITEGRDTVGFTSSPSKNIVGAIVEGRSTLNASTSASRSVTAGIVEGRDVLALNAGANPTRNITVGIQEGRDSVSVNTAAALNLAFGIREGASTVSVIVQSTKNVSFGIAENRDVLAFNSGLNPTRNITAVIAEGRDTVSLGATASRSITASVREGSATLNLLPVLNKNIAAAIVEGWDVLAFSTGNAAQRNITVGIQEGADKIALPTTASLPVTIAEAEGRTTLAATVINTGPVLSIGIGIAERRATISGVLNAAAPLSITNTNFGDVPGGGFVTLTGMGFVNVTSVSFSGTPALFYLVLSSTAIQVQLPYGGTQTGTFSVTANGQTGVGASANRVFADQAPVHKGGGPDKKKRKRRPGFIPRLYDLTPYYSIPVIEPLKKVEVALFDEENERREIQEIIEMLDTLDGL
jgi:IPT/TIG domain